MSKVKEAVLAIFFTLFALSTFAQTGSVRGRIIDAKTKKPLEFVNVSIRATGTQTPLTGTVSDSTGVFRISEERDVHAHRLVYRLQIRGKRIHDLADSKKREREKHPFGRRQPSNRRDTGCRTTGSNEIRNRQKSL